MNNKKERHSPDGKTHFQNDGCGEKEHNDTKAFIGGTYPPTTTWEKEFERFREILKSPDDDETYTFGQIKSFISKLLAEAREEGYKEGLNLRKEYNDPELIKKIAAQAKAETIEKAIAALKEIK